MAPGFIRDLIDRRVPQYTALYVAGGWGVVQFLSFAEERYMLSPHLTDLVLLLVGLLLPSVVLFTWFHGRPGADNLRTVEKFFIPINVIATAAILFLVFSGKELGAVTTSVTVEDGEGNAISRAVPKTEFQKRMAIFPLEADSLWLGEAVMAALTIELAQDAFVDLRPVQVFREQLREAGYLDGRRLPAALKRTIAEEQMVQYWLEGTVERGPAGYVVRLILNDAASSRPVTERTHEGGDLTALIDRASIQLRRDLGIPERYIEEVTDLPAGDLLSASLPALRGYAEAHAAYWIRDDYAAASDHLRRAVEADPGFAAASLFLYQLQVFAGDVASARASLGRAIEHDYRLSERMQYMAKAEYFAMQQDMRRAFAAYEMWAELYPNDIQAQLAAAQIRIYQGDLAGAIAAYESALALDPGRMDLLLQIAGLQQRTGNNEQAVEVLERYSAAFPEDVKGIVQLAGIHARSGEHDEARRLYERALLLEPGDVNTRTAIANLDLATGRFDDALRSYEAALASARTSDQRAVALEGLRAWHSWRGAYARALDYLEQSLTERAASQPPVYLVQARLLEIGAWVSAGMADSARTLLRTLAPMLQPPIDAVVPVGRIALWGALENVDSLAAAVADADAMLERTGINAIQQQVIAGRVRLHELRAEWREALAELERERAIDPNEVSVAARAGRFHRELGDLAEAERLLLDVLRSRPSDGRVNYDLALVYERQGRTADAVARLRTALDTWAIADPSYERARLARAKLAELGGT